MIICAKPETCWWPEGGGAIWSNLRQRRYPKEFRIPPGLALGPEVRSKLEEIKHLIINHTDGPGEAHLAAVATTWWEASRRAARLEELLGEDSPLGPQVRRMQAILEEMDRELRKLGVAVIDDEGKEWDEGDARWEVEGGEVVSGLALPVIATTLRPAVFREGRLLQRGKILVNFPGEGRKHADH